MSADSIKQIHISSAYKYNPLNLHGLNHSPQVFQISFNLNKWNNLNATQKNDFEFSLRQFAENNKDLFEKKQAKINYLEKMNFSDEISTVEEQLKSYQSQNSNRDFNSTIEALDQYIKFRNIEQSISSAYLPLLAKRHNFKDILEKYEFYRSDVSSNYPTRLG